MNEQKSQRTMPVVLWILLALAGGIAIFFGIKQSQKAKESAMRQATIDSLDMVRTNLEAEVNRLNTEYSLIAIENDSLTGSLDNARQVIAQREQQLRRAQRKAANDVNAIKEDIAALEADKSQLMETISNLKSENDSLLRSNEELTERLAVSEEKNTQLVGQVDELEMANDILEKRSAELVNTSYKASAIQVNIANKNDRSTIRARKVRNFKVSFDLVDVPEEFRGEQTIYLTITDANGVPISGETEKVRVGENQKALVIEALEKKKVDIGESQRLELSHDLDEKVQKGFLIFSVYADKGLLGSTMFQLI